MGPEVYPYIQRDKGYWPHRPGKDYRRNFARAWNIDSITDRKTPRRENELCRRGPRRWPVQPSYSRQTETTSFRRLLPSISTICCQLTKRQRQVCHFIICYLAGINVGTSNRAVGPISPTKNGFYPGTFPKIRERRHIRCFYREIQRDIKGRGRLWEVLEE
jgi:hypothetical protein